MNVKKTFYRNATELFASNIPKPLTPKVTITKYIDTNLCHDMFSGNSATGIMNFLNKTIINLYCKKQTVFETASYGLEYMAAKIAVERIMDLRTSMKYLGVDIDGELYMLVITGPLQKVHIFHNHGCKNNMCYYPLIICVYK